MVNIMTTKGYKKMAVLLLLAVFWAMCMCAPALAAETVSVVNDILPIMSAPGKDYTIDEEGYVRGDDIEGVVVYGNRLEVRPIANTKLKNFSSAWVELLSPEGEMLGYIEKKGLESFPKYKELQGSFMMKRDDPKLLLLPGKDEKRYDLSSWGFTLAKGEVVNVRGESEAEGKKWLLLSFNTQLESGGVGERYLWALADDLTNLSDYKPDPSKIDTALLPSKMRTDADFFPVTDEFRTKLLKNGFAIDSKPLIREWGINVDDMADYYLETGSSEADFITTDIFLHSFHLIFDHMLQKFERTYLAPRLADSMKDALDVLGNMIPPQPNEAAHAIAQDMFSVVSALLLEDPSSAKMSPRAAKEVQRVLAANEMSEVSEITGKKFDYTQCLPRGHYTITPELERYFRAMSYAGSAELNLFDDKGAFIPENIAAAAFVCMAIDTIGESQSDSWEAFEEPIEFLIGAPNTGGSQIYRKLVGKHIGPISHAQSMENLADTTKLAALAEDIKTTVPGPLIQAAPGGDDDNQDGDFTNRAPVFRISSKRFVYDAYVFNQLTSPRVGTDANPRNIPKGTDVMAVLDSEAATRLAKKDDDIENYTKNLGILKSEVNEYLSADTVYARWLNALKSSFENSGATQFFYRSPAWQWKKLVTASASWAELKHDTILYAEQSGAELGGGGDDWKAGEFDPPLPRGYVEPAPQTFSALLNATARMKEFIEKYKIEDLQETWDEKEGLTYAAKLDTFSKLLETARSIAEKEVSGEALTQEEYASIKSLARSFDTSLLLPGGWDVRGLEAAELLKMALIADVASDYFSGKVLEAAIGTPRRIYVFVDDTSGGARITRGYMFSYYEFESEKRWTDDDWKKMVYDEDQAEELKGYHPTWWDELDK